VVSPFCREGEAGPKASPYRPTPCRLPLCLLLFLFLASHEACGVVGWSVRKHYWVIKEACSEGSDDAQGHLGPLRSCESKVRKVKLIVLAQGEAVQRIPCSSGWEGSCCATLGSFKRSCQGAPNGVLVNGCVSWCPLGRTNSDCHKLPSKYERRPLPFRRPPPALP
jgi:hypothetical protein